MPLGQPISPAWVVLGVAVSSSGKALDLHAKSLDVTAA